jgi:predicted site-specific integrase-resolvase
LQVIFHRFEKYLEPFEAHQQVLLVEVVDDEVEVDEVVDQLIEIMKL